MCSSKQKIALFETLLKKSKQRQRMKEKVSYLTYLLVTSFFTLFFQLKKFFFCTFPNGTNRFFPFFLFDFQFYFFSLKFL